MVSSARVHKEQISHAVLSTRRSRAAGWSHSNLALRTGCSCGGGRGSACSGGPPRRGPPSGRAPLFAPWPSAAATKREGPAQEGGRPARDARPPLRMRQPYSGCDHPAQDGAHPAQEGDSRAQDGDHPAHSRAALAPSGGDHPAHTWKPAEGHKPTAAEA
eukprot:351567-Prymnesium_polylepis.1